MSALTHIKKHQQTVSIFIVWLFTSSAIIGMSIGHYDWFIIKTPLNLLVLFSLLIINFPINTLKKLGLVSLFFLCGFMAEWVGVHYGFLFGDYYYGGNLGFSVDGIPLLIGINWVILILTTAGIVQHHFQSLWLKVISGAILMVILDFFIEPLAPLFDFWYWTDGSASVHNFIGWFVVASLLHFVYVKATIKGSFVFSLHVYLAQLTFFVYFYFYHGI